MEESDPEPAEQLFETEQGGVTGSRAAKADVTVALLSYLMGYLFLERSWNRAGSAAYIVLHVLFLLLMVGAAEFRFRNVKRSRESLVWLGCLLLSSAGVVLCRDGVWDAFQQHLFQAGFYVWWLLSRSGVLLEGKSSSFLAADALNGFIRIPFGNFGLRVRTLFQAAGQRRSERNGSGIRQAGLIAGSVILSAVLFCRAFRFLSDADPAFGRWAGSLLTVENLPDLSETVVKLLLSLPVGAWLCGLIAGSGRISRESLDGQKQRISDRMAALKNVPAGVWIAVTAAFSLLYAAFFAFQTSYLFGAFLGRLPEGFIVSEYARQGFFELCKVSCVNFALIWMADRTGSGSGRTLRAVRIASVVMLAENLLFSLISLSKLYMYIRMFGFTPRRLESSWLACVILAGCIAWLVSIFTRKPVFRKWLFFSAVSLSMLCLV